MWIEPPRLWTWFQSLPWWGKALLVVPILVLLVLALVWFLTGGALVEAVKRKGDPLKTAVDLHEDAVDDRYDRAEEEDRRLAERIDAIESLKARSEGEREREAKEREDRHREIDAADSIADVNRVLRDERERRRRR